MLERMTSAHVAQIVEIHVSSWATHELSIKLGPAYLKLFYSHVARSPHACGYVSVESGRVIGYATGFYDYQAFNSDFARRHFLRLGLILLGRVLTGRIGRADLANLFGDGGKLRKARYPHHHLGALALDNAFKGTSMGRQVITDAIQAVLFDLALSGCPGCWGLCDAGNAPMRRYLVRLGFDEVDVVDMAGKRAVLYERALVGQPGEVRL